MLKSSLAIASLVLAGAGLFAALPASADPQYDQCVGREHTNLGWTKCGGALVQRKEGELNRVWGRVNARIPREAKAPLLAEQRLWIAYKDRSCQAWQSGAWGREGAVLEFYPCRARVIDDRIAYLNALGKR